MDPRFRGNDSGVEILRHPLPFGQGSPQDDVINTLPSYSNNDWASCSIDLRYLSQWPAEGSDVDFFGRIFVSF
jgi:hypothetical protein